ncbi:MAG: glycine/betaine ABC transporter substrate-binding protein [Halanaerobiales bacterium]|nr:glycine/betaine ABC transporter substrate-binding protein [Halanaerobiales bacterium]
MKKTFLLLLVLFMAFVLVGCGKADIVVGGKDFTEQDILVQILSELIEAKTDLKVERKAYLGGSTVVANALDSGSLDIYVEYTGTALISILDEKVMNDPEAVYDLVKKRYIEEKDIIWLKPLGFNNTFAITMKESKAKEIGIKSLSDLVEFSDSLSFASTQEFLEREDGYNNLQEVYGIKFKDVRGMDPGLCYVAVRDDKVDVNVSFATDGRIPAFNLVVLEDDKDFFPPYYAAPLIKKDTLNKYPELEQVLNLLAGRLDDKTMADLNAKVDIEKQNSKNVAVEWLREEGLIE